MIEKGVDHGVSPWKNMEDLGIFENWMMERKNGPEIWRIGSWSGMRGSSLFKKHVEISWIPSKGYALIEIFRKDKKKVEKIINTPVFLDLDPEKSFMDLMVFERVLEEIAPGEWRSWA